MTEQTTTWRKSSFSGSQADCVEVADTTGAVLVRDTKNRGGLVLAVSADAWARFTATIK